MLVAPLIQLRSRRAGLSLSDEPKATDHLIESFPPRWASEGIRADGDRDRQSPLHAEAQVPSTLHTSHRDEGEGGLCLMI